MPRLTQHQKAARKLGIGSSDVAELIGISPYEGNSPIRLFAEKTGIIIEEDEEETIEQEVGHALEGALRSLYEVKSGYRVLATGEYVESVRHPDHPWRQANLDGRIEGKRAALEIKAVGIGMASDWDLMADDGIPNYVHVQVAWQMHVADLDEVHVVALIGGPSGFRVFYIKRDLELEALIVAAAAEFWANVDARKVPPLDGTVACRKYLETIHPTPAADIEVELDEERDAELVDAGRRRVKASLLEAKAKDAKEIANNEIRDGMGTRGATIVWCKSWRATWKPDKNGRRNLLVTGRGDLAEVKVRQPKANAVRLPDLVGDGEVM